jgi:hypothetical protein
MDKTFSDFLQAPLMALQPLLFGDITVKAATLTEVDLNTNPEQ